MRKTTAIPLLARHWLNGIFLALLMGLVTTPAVAVLSDKTGQIQGHTPTASGRLQVLYPDESAVANSTLIREGQIPNQFRVSPSTAQLVLEDIDGDGGLSAQIDTQAATLTWQRGGATLTSAQLTAPFEKNNDLSGKALALEVSAPMTVSSATGIPLTAGAKPYTSTYALLVPAFLDSATIDKTEVQAGGQDYAEVLYRLVDGNGDPVEGVKLTWHKFGNCSLSSPIITDADGRASTRVTNLSAGTCRFYYTFTDSVNGSYIYSQQLGPQFNVTFT